MVRYLTVIYPTFVLSSECSGAESTNLEVRSAGVCVCVCVVRLTFMQENGAHVSSQICMNISVYEAEL